MALGILGQLHDTGIGDEMIESARNYVLGQFPTQFETASQLATQFAALEEYGLDKAYIDEYGAALLEATPGSVHNAISDAYPTLDNLVFVLIGDADVIRDDIEQYGPVTEVSITAPRFRQ